MRGGRASKPPLARFDPCPTTATTCSSGSSRARTPPRRTRTLELAQLAEVSGLDLVTVQDHPYQAKHLDAWTLLSVIAARTTAIRVAPNVANLPLRPPVVLARAVRAPSTCSAAAGSSSAWAPGRSGTRSCRPAARVVRRGGGRRARARRSRSSAQMWARRHRPRVDGEHYRVKGLHARPVAGARHPDLARRLQAADAAPHRPTSPTAGCPAVGYADPPTSSPR